MSEVLTEEHRGAAASLRMSAAGLINALRALWLHSEFKPELCRRGLYEAGGE